MSEQEVNWQEKAGELAKRNIELETKVAELAKELEATKSEAAAWHKEADDTVMAHNSVREQTMAQLANLSAYVANTRLMTSGEQAQQRAAMEAQASLMAKKEGKK